MEDTKISEMTLKTEMNENTFVPFIDETNDPVENNRISRDDLFKAIKGYKSISGVITQADTDTPEVAIDQNDFEGEPEWSYEDVGSFKATLSGQFTSGKTRTIIGTPYGGATAFFSFYSNDGDTAVLVTKNIAGAPTNGLLTSTFFEIRVYPETESES